VDGGDPEAVENVLRDRLALVEVTAHADDNVHRIFESLNNTGLNLTQADLLRNYIFMLLPNRGEHVYEVVWLPMQDLLGTDNLELLVFLDLVLAGVERVKRTEIYRAQQTRLRPFEGDEGGIEKAVAELARRAPHLKRLLEPAREPDAGLRAFLFRLDRWGAQVTFPVLMYLMDLQERGMLEVEEGHVHNGEDLESVSVA
jgi:hypothetical protein